MFSYLFRKLYLRAKVRIEAENGRRIAQENPPMGISCAEYSYIDDGDPLHMLNLYKPQNCADVKALPLIVDIHGGGWICGDKDTNNNFCSHLAVGGNVVASLSYRTIDRCTIREQVQDTLAFFRWAQEHSEEYGLNIRQVFLTGDSAGAQLALLAYCVSKSSELSALFSAATANICVRGMILASAEHYD